MNKNTKKSRGKYMQNIVGVLLRIIIFYRKHFFAHQEHRAWIIL